MAEVGLPALNFGAWWGMWGPPGLPAELTNDHQRLGQRCGQGTGAEGRLAALGIEPYAETPQFFAKFIAEDSSAAPSY